MFKSSEYLVFQIRTLVGLPHTCRRLCRSQTQGLRPRKLCMSWAVCRPGRAEALGTGGLACPGQRDDHDSQMPLAPEALHVPGSIPHRTWPLAAEPLRVLGGAPPRRCKGLGSKGRRAAQAVQRPRLQRPCMSWAELRPRHVKRSTPKALHVLVRAPPRT